MWEPVSTKRSEAFPNGTSSDVQVIENVFGSPPWIFGPEHVDKLRAMAATTRLRESIYDDIARLIEDSGIEISVSPEW